MAQKRQISLRLRSAALLTLAVTFVGVGAVRSARSEHAGERIVDFNQDIRPLLIDKCSLCHGPDEDHRQADLRLDIEQGARADLGGYRALVPGEPKESALIARITADDPSERMPPVDSGKDLSKADIELLRRWIEQGAKWEDPWSYVSPIRHAVPAVEIESWPIHWVDHFVLARLESERLEPSAEADRVTLIRRLNFDLTGLPPTPAEVDEFCRDDRPDAYERVVDRLLASHHFGERLAIYWLDLVRYANTVGYHGDQDHHISPYRDWVIDALNDNLSFDEFTRFQLAGDLLPDTGVDGKVASGYNRLLQTSHEGGVQPKEYLTIYAADRVRNLSAVWMGATLGCAQCHDHKYDPYTMRDFYSMAAFFADVAEEGHFTEATDVTPTQRPPEMEVLSRRDQEELQRVEQELIELQARLAQVEEARSVPGDVSEEDDAEGTELGGLAQRVENAQHRREAVLGRKRKTMITVTIEPRTIRILPRGNWLDDSGDIVQPAVPAFLGNVGVHGRRANRLDLANWLMDVQQGAGGLTARVMVNRLWYLFFGVGLARVLDDFGGQGEPPAHPELLDNLAVEFVESGWDIKQITKLLVMSRAYRQSSITPPELRQRDPYNQLVARQSRFRLPAEIIRDNALAISGLLIPQVGGATSRPYQPSGYYRHLNFPKRTYEHHDDFRQWRRGIYVHWQRQFLHPMLQAFDAPRREECTAERPRSNTPLAAMAALNDPTFVEAARVFAEKILREAGSTTNERLDFAFRWAVSRLPDGDERVLLATLLGARQQRYEEDADAAQQLISTGQAPVPADLDAKQLAAWTGVARAILNMNETMTRY